jgi:2,3-bisphosphoglycerate-dependent phosphoglycerate mutase
MSLLILMRHGQSLWNKQNIFTGWVDVPLSQKGIEEATKGGEAIAHLPIDIVFTSELIRAHMTTMLALLPHQAGKIPVMLPAKEDTHPGWGKIYEEKTLKNTLPVHKAWELNERMYGELQGMNKAEMAEKYGEQQIKIWRRSYDVPPPRGESLEMTAARSIPYFEKSILPELHKGLNVFVCAHGNSLRSIMMEIEGLSKEQVLQLELPTGLPVIYEVTKKGNSTEYVKK